MAYILFLGDYSHLLVLLDLLSFSALVVVYSAAPSALVIVEVPNDGTRDSVGLVPALASGLVLGRRGEGRRQGRVESYGASCGGRSRADGWTEFVWCEGVCLA